MTVAALRQTVAQRGTNCLSACSIGTLVRWIGVCPHAFCAGAVKRQVTTKIPRKVA
ncbi:hypothetical protein ALP05_00875 [Pseudomonas caricapapayae]|uniref:Uncharacterized protein n=1 Tax=Pseudomonas caricapapayae TaxID=46678 RepID=A0A3M6F9E0_9PSED|nr:hypothetical protein ALP05_00875 [Pseudomonas caricapapayae]